MHFSFQENIAAVERIQKLQFLICLPMKLIGEIGKVVNLISLVPKIANPRSV